MTTCVVEVVILYNIYLALNPPITMLILSYNDIVQRKLGKGVKQSMVCIIIIVMCMPVSFSLEYK